MTMINSAITPGRALQVREHDANLNFQVVDYGAGGLAVTVDRAELLAAAGVDTCLSEAVEAVKETGGAVEIRGVRIEPCDTYGSTDTTRRAKEAEAEAFKAGYAAAEAERDAAVARAEAERDAAVGRAEAAEATIQRVREWLDGDEQFDKLDAILGPVPFALPTETGARIECRNESRGTVVFRVVRDGSFGTKYLYEGKDVLWSGESVMEEMRDHRLIGADE